MPQIDIKNLEVSFDQIGGEVLALQGVTLTLEKGESLGIVGESGSGKSVTFLSVLGLLPRNSAQVRAEKLEAAGVDVLCATPKDLRKIRGRLVSMIFQDPMSAFDPMFTVGSQISETLLAHTDMSRREALDEAISLLRQVDIPHPEAVCKLYPHQMSGGMLQRAMIAMALSCRPETLIADEPTTALDVTVQAQILQLISDLRQERGMGLVMITHDLGVVAETVDNVVVMYGGRVAERAPVTDIFENAKHPYSRALLATMNTERQNKGRLAEIPGSTPRITADFKGCPFASRCPEADQVCYDQCPGITQISDNHEAACWRLQP